MFTYFFFLSISRRPYCKTFSAKHAVNDMFWSPSTRELLTAGANAVIKVR